MTYRGRVKDGVVVLDEPLPEGTEVEVLPRPACPAAVEQPQTLNERYQSFIGIVDGLPPDMSEQHDHYLYGTPKRE